MKKYLICFFWFPLFLGALSENSGRSGSAFLKSEKNAFISSMGGAYAASQDVKKIPDGNPASAGILSNHLLSLDVNMGLGGRFDTGIQVTTEKGFSFRGYFSRNAVIDTGEQRFASFMSGIGYGKALKKLLVGGNFNYFFEKSGQVNNNGFFCDAGFNVIFNHQFSAGGLVKNIGYSELNKSRQDTLPLTSVLGMEYRLEANRYHTFVFSSDLEFRYDFLPAVHAGFSYRLRNLLLFNTGYVYRWNKNNLLGFGSGLSIGVGLNAGKVDIMTSINPKGPLGTEGVLSVQLRL